MISVSKSFFTITSCTVVVTEFIDFSWSNVTDCLTNVESSTVYKDIVVQGQGPERFKDKYLELGPWGQGLSSRTTTLGITHEKFENSYWIYTFSSNLEAQYNLCPRVLEIVGTGHPGPRDGRAYMHQQQMPF